MLGTAQRFDFVWHPFRDTCRRFWRDKTAWSRTPAFISMLVGMGQFYPFYNGSRRSSDECLWGVLIAISVVSNQSQDSKVLVNLQEETLSPWIENEWQ